MDAQIEGPMPGIPTAIVNRIRTRLQQVEAEHGVRILYACESGSRGWGFESPDSDYDARFVYVHDLPWYLRVVPGRDVIEPSSDDLLDLSGWDLRKALALLQAGNAQLVEWLDSPIIYQADPRFLDRLKGLLPSVHRTDRSFYHYMHMARRNYHQYIEGRDRIRLKKYLYVLRPVLAAIWIEQGRGPAPMPFQDLVSGLVTEPPLLGAIEYLLNQKRAGLESEQAPPIPEISAFLDQEFARLGTVPMSKGPVPDPGFLDALMLEAAMNWGPGQAYTEHPHP